MVRSNWSDSKALYSISEHCAKWKLNILLLSIPLSYICSNIFEIRPKSKNIITHTHTHTLAQITFEIEKRRNLRSFPHKNYKKW